MKHINTKILAIIVLLFICFQAKAVPAYPYPVTIQQADGTTISIVLNGDEYHHYHTTVDGYLIKKDAHGIFKYATVDNIGKVTTTAINAKNKEKRSNTERDFLKLIPQNPDFSKQNSIIKMQKTVKSSSEYGIVPLSKYPRTGSPRSLVILVNFNDVEYVIDNPQVAFTNLLNQDGYAGNGGTGSAKDYFRDNSMGTFQPQFDVVGPYTLPENRSFYGGNNSNGNDKNPVQMVVDACRLADQNGVDFTIYDTDNNGLVDNVFIYYAGHNEAELASAETVWPHRWAIYPTAIYGNGNYGGTIESITFDGKRILDYACTSELKKNSGAHMCGIGTFSHEFGHVIGLADMYPTDNSKHHTLSDWSIMDAGAYLNEGRTPPAYNAFERFQLGFMTPEMLTKPANIVLNPLLTSNEAYLISSTETHNLAGNNPIPKEFFLLENRQKDGWDTYLPGHGMLIYRINWNTDNMKYNRPNNDPNKMGVDIIEADGIANNNSLDGDPFPGKANVTTYTPKLINGTILEDKPITFITEENNRITFRFQGGSNSPIIKFDGVFQLFETEQNTPSGMQQITVLGQKLIDNLQLSFLKGNHYEMKKITDAETSWAKSITLHPVDSVVEPTTIQVRYNPTEPSFVYTHQDALILSSKLAEEKRIELSGKSTRKVYITSPKAADATGVTYKSFLANWNTVMDNDKPAAGYYFTVVQKNTNGTDSVVINNKWTTQTSDTVYNLISDRDYYYSVKASDKNKALGYENITQSSNTISVHTLPYPFEKELRVTINNGVVRVYLPQKQDDKNPDNNGVIHVFNTLGQRLMTIPAVGDVMDLDMLPKQMILILQSGKQRAKVLLL